MRAKLPRKSMHAKLFGVRNVREDARLMADGTSNWKAISPAAAKKLKGILKWNRTTSHPHRKCVEALMGKGVPKENADKICAVAKDRALRTTKWRNGGG